MENIFISQIKKSEFFKNVLILASGRGLAMIIPFIIAPILSRLYTPEDFGVLAIYIMCVQVLSSIAAFTYEYAIILPLKNKDVFSLIYLCGVIVICYSLLLFIIILIFHEYIVDLLGNPIIADWLYFIPLNVLFISFFNVLNYYYTRQKEYSVVAKSNVLKSIGLSGVQLCFGVITGGAGGLILGQLVSVLFGNTQMIRKFLKNIRIITRVSSKNLYSVARTYLNFPLYFLGNVLINNISLNVINLIINSIYSTKTLGYYSYSYKYLSLPSALIGDAIGQVYFEKISCSLRNGLPIQKIFILTLKRLLLIGIPIFGILFFIVEDLFAFVFGEVWRVAGEYAKIIMPLILIRFIAMPLSLTYIALERQKLALFMQILLIIFTLLPAVFSYVCGWEIRNYLVLNTIVLSLFYLVMLSVAYKISFVIKNNL